MSHYGITPFQSEALNFIKSYIEAKGYSPSYKEIGKGLGLKSTSGVHRAIHALAERGHVRILPYRQRSIELT